MNFLQELLLEMNLQQQSEIEAANDLSNLGIQDANANSNRGVLNKRKEEKKKQIANLEQSDDPIDRQIATLRKQIATLLAKKQQQLKQQAQRTV